MKKKIAFAAMITGLLLLATTLAYSQDSRSTLNQTFTSDSAKCKISKIIPDVGRGSINVSLINLNLREEYHLVLYTSGGQQLGSYWVDQDATTLFVGNIPPDTYILILMEGNRIVDRKQLMVK